MRNARQSARAIELTDSMGIVGEMGQTHKLFPCCDTLSPVPRDTNASWHVQI